MISHESAQIAIASMKTFMDILREQYEASDSISDREALMEVIDEVYNACMDIELALLFGDNAPNMN